MLQLNYNLTLVIERNIYVFVYNLTTITTFYPAAMAAESFIDCKIKYL